MLTQAFRSSAIRTRVFEAYQAAHPSARLTGATPSALAAALAWVLRMIDARAPAWTLVRRALPRVSGELRLRVVELPPSSEPVKRHYIDLLLVDQRGEPVPGGPFVITTPDGELTSTFGALGAAYFTISAAGSARVKMSDAELVDDKRGIIELELKTPDGRPASHVAFEVKGPDGKIVRGMTDEAGRAIASGLPDGESELTFPELDTSAWQRGEPSSGAPS